MVATEEDQPVAYLHEDPDDPVSYSVRVPPETPGQVLANRISVTASLFATAIGGALLLGGRRRG